MKNKINKLLIILLVYSGSFALAACDSKDYLKQLSKDAKKIQDKTIDQQKLQELNEIMLKSGAHNKCYSCDYSWNKETDPNLY